MKKIIIFSIESERSTAVGLEPGKTVFDEGREGLARALELQRRRPRAIGGEGGGGTLTTLLLPLGPSGLEAIHLSLYLSSLYLSIKPLLFSSDASCWKRRSYKSRRSRLSLPVGVVCGPNLRQGNTKENTFSH